MLGTRGSVRSACSRWEVSGHDMVLVRRRHGDVWRSTVGKVCEAYCLYAEMDGGEKMVDMGSLRYGFSRRHGDVGRFMKFLRFAFSTRREG